MKTVWYGARVAAHECGWKPMSDANVLVFVLIKKILKNLCLCSDKFLNMLVLPPRMAWTYICLGLSLNFVSFGLSMLVRLVVSTVYSLLNNKKYFTKLFFSSEIYLPISWSNNCLRKSSISITIPFSEDWQKAVRKPGWKSKNSLNFAINNLNHALTGTYEIVHTGTRHNRSCVCGWMLVLSSIFLKAKEL